MQTLANKIGEKVAPAASHKDLTVSELICLYLDDQKKDHKGLNVPQKRFFVQKCKELPWRGYTRRKTDIRLYSKEYTVYRKESKYYERVPETDEAGITMGV